jgi:cytochrome c oxidase cbb3-type subunit 2
MMFIRTFVFFLGLLAAVLLGWIGLVGLPSLMLNDIKPAPEQHRYTSEELFGRSIYIREGCIYCHSQQPRPKGFGADQERFWGRPAVPADYVYDKPHLLGTMRTGPDLFNIAVRQPSEEWHLLHLYNPRLLQRASVMPPYPWLFEVKPTAGPNEKPLAIPDSIRPKNSVVVPSNEGKALVAYLLSLDHSYPVIQTAVRDDSTK